MKHEYLKKQMQNQHPKGICNAQLPIFDLKVIRTAVPNHPSVGGTGGRLPKGPPGRSRSPGWGDALFPGKPPDAAATPDRVQNPVGGDDNNQTFEVSETSKVSKHTDYQILNDKQIPNFFTLLIFTKMKKQILFLAFFVLAALASITDSYGQVDMPVSTRTPYDSGTCTTNDSPLNPRPGKAYEYGVTIGNAGSLVGGAVNGYSWWATKNPEFVIGTTTATVSPNWGDRLTPTPGGGLINAGTGYGTTGGTASMSITWHPSTLAGTDYQGLPGPGTPTFVAVMTNGACSNNIQVWEINPQPAFTVDITNIATASATAENYGNTISSCVSPVVSATYNSGSKDIDMDYGRNTIYFEVISANFVGSWTPTITLTGLGTDETASITIHDSWAEAQAGTEIKETLEFTADGTEVGTVALGTTVSNTTSGVSVWLAVTIDHNTYENLATRPIRVTIAGMDTTGEFDLANNCTTTTAVDTDDFAIQDITPRPDIDDTINDPSYNSIDPGTFIPKPNP